MRPVLWIYNCRFQNVIKQRYSVLNVFHKLKDYQTNVLGKVSNYWHMRHLDKILGNGLLVNNKSTEASDCLVKQEGCKKWAVTINKSDDYSLDHINDYLNNTTDELCYSSEKLNIAILYEPSSSLISTIREHLESFYKYQIMQFRTCLPPKV